MKQTEKRPRKSWVVWEEGGQYPDIIIELLSDSTAKVDKTLKKTLYETRFRTPEYFWFSPETLEIEGYRLVDQAYETVVPDKVGLWSQVLGLYLDVRNGQLRYVTQDGELVPTPGEAAQQAQDQLKESTTRAEQLAEQLKRLGVEPEA